MKTTACAIICALALCVVYADASKCVSGTYKPVLCAGLMFENKCAAREAMYDPASCFAAEDAADGRDVTTCECGISEGVADAVQCMDVDFGSLCEAECNGFDASTCRAASASVRRHLPWKRGDVAVAGEEGSCECGPTYAPVHCGDSMFRNTCEAGCAGTDTNMCVEAKVSTDCKCKPVFEPVQCGHAMFSNTCEAECAGAAVTTCVDVAAVPQEELEDEDSIIAPPEDSEAPDVEDNASLPAAFSAGSCRCPDVRAPVKCGAEAYGNVCLATCAGRTHRECKPMAPRKSIDKSLRAGRQCGVVYDPVKCLDVGAVRWHASFTQIGQRFSTMCAARKAGFDESSCLRLRA